MNMYLMIMQLRPGTIGGIIAGVIVCAIFAFVCMKIAKKEGASLEQVLSTVPEDLKNELKAQPYTEASGKDMYTTNALVTSVDEEGDKTKATLLFYAPEHESFYTRNIKLSKSDADSKGIALHRFVPALMKYDREMHYHDYKKLV